MISVDYNSKENIFYVTMSNEIHLKDLFDYFNHLIDNYSHLNKLVIYEDSQDAETKFSTDGFLEIRRELDRLMDNFNSVVIAKQIANPKETAMGLFYNETRIALKNYFFKVFSTKESALFWLNTFQQ